jgi:hypothetical protein
MIVNGHPSKTYVSVLLTEKPFWIAVPGSHEKSSSSPGFFFVAFSAMENRRRK